MPAKRTTSTTKRSQAAPKKANNRKFVIGIFAVVSLLFVGFFFYWILGGSMSTEQQKMETYLKDKYGQEFVVKNVRVTGSGLGVTGSIRGDAYPKNDPSLKFELRKPEDKNFYDYDSFLTELWSRQGREQVDKFVKELGSVRSYSLRIGTDVSFSQTLHGHTPSFSEVQAKGQPVFSYTLNISSTIPGTDNEPTESELMRALKVKEFVAAQKSPNPEFTYTYRSPNFRANDGKSYDQYVITARSTDTLDAIRQPDDLRQYFDLTYVAKQVAQ